MKRMKSTALVLALLLALLVPGQAYGAEEKEKEVKVRSVEMSLESVTVRPNQTRILWAYTYPLKATDDSVTWESSDYDVVVVEDGTLIAIAPGTAQVTATSSNGKQGVCQVTVLSGVIRSMQPDVETKDLPRSDLTSGELLPAAALRLAVEEALASVPAGQSATVTYSDKTGVSGPALRGAAYSAEYLGKNVSLSFRTMGASGIQGQLTIDPKQAGETTGKIKLGVYTAPEQTKDAGAVPLGTIPIKLAHEGAFGMNVRVAAKLSLGEMDPANLVVYAGDNGVWTPLPVQDAAMDKNGYLHFTTDRGGLLAVGEKRLS